MLLILVTSGVFAQDIHLSQYDASPMYLNPAMTGKFNGRMRLVGHYRTQWRSILQEDAYVTTGFSADRPLKNNISVGAQIMNQKAGAGNFGEFRFMLSGAYDLFADSKRGNRVSFGLQAGVIQKGFDPTGLYFQNQYDPGSGGFDNTLSSGESFSGTKINIMDVNAGFVWFKSGESNRINPFVGASVFHLNQPKESFFGADNALPMRYVFHGGIKLNVSEKLQFIPKGWLQQEVNAQELTTTFVIHYYLKEQGAYLIAAPTYRLGDANILELGMKYDDFLVRVSYDFNTSTLKPTTTGRGGFELSVTWIQEKKRPDPIPNCPRL